MRTTLSTSEGECVLIVDDQERNLELVGTVLSMTGFEVLTAQSGALALELLGKRIPDLILLDVLMPEIDGIETCRMIKANVDWRAIPIIFLSAADDKNLIVQALECGGVDYVTKPFNKAELLSRVRTHLALKDARDRLKALAEDKDELLGILAHDLQNHLAGMRMSADLLKSRAGLMPEKCEVFIENIVQSSESLLTFVKEFLANQSAERLCVTRNTIDIKESLLLALRRLEPLATSKKIELLFQPPDESIVATGDEEALARVLDNLGSNAIKFSPSEKKVYFRVECINESWVEILVQDEGPGFSEGDLEKIFKRYARLSAKPTGGEPSTGLGLSIVKKLVDAMKGHLTVKNGEDGGACFQIKLPVTEGCEK